MHFVCLFVSLVFRFDSAFFTCAASRFTHNDLHVLQSIDFGTEATESPVIDALLEEEEANPLHNTTQWQKRFDHIVKEIRRYP
jgi:hypothetical protein